MKFIKIKATNFLSLKDFELDLDSQGLLLLDGKNLDSKEGAFEQNGVGKSTILASIFYALFGETPDGRTADAVINKTAKKNTSVELTFEASNHVFMITRGRKKNVLTLTRDNEEVSFSTMKETQSHIEELIGIPEDVFRTTLFFDGHYSTPFSEMTDKQKKTFLSAIVDLEVYTKAHDKTKEDIRDLKAKLATTESNISIAKESSQRELDNIKRLQEMKSQFEAAYEQAKERLANLDLSDKDTYAIKLSEANEELYKASKYKSTNEAQRALSEATTSSQRLYSNLTTLENKKQQRLGYLETLKGNLKATMEMKKQYEHLNSNAYTKENLVESFDLGVAGQPKESLAAIIPGAANNIEDIRQLDIKLAEGIKEYKSLDPDEFNQEIVAKQQEFDISKEQLAQLQVNANKEVQANNAMQSNYQQEVTKVNKLKQAIQELETKQATLEQSVESAKTNLDLINQQLAGYGTTDLSKDAATRVKELEMLRDNLAKQIIDLEQVLGAFSDQGIKSHVLDLVTPTLNQGVNKYLSSLTGGAITIEFSTQTKKADGTLSDKFDIRVFYNSLETGYNSLSSGEKRRVDVAISLALQDMVLQRYGDDINLLAYDELFESLDATGAENVIELLKERTNKVGTIIVVSHNEDLKPLFDKTITVIKKEGVSTLEGI